MNLTSTQRIALDTARAVVAAGKAREETGEYPGDWAYWAGRYRGALEIVIEAFPAPVTGDDEALS